MKRSNLIPITRIYDIYPKYTYSEDVKKFMDEIVDIDRANVYTKDEVMAMLTELRAEIEKQEKWLLQASCTSYNVDMGFAYNVDIAFDAIKAIIAESEG